MPGTDDDQIGAAIPEADRLEQEQPVDAGVGAGEGWPASAPEDVDPPDLLEQAHEVLDDPDEEYAPDPP